MLTELAMQAENASQFSNAFGIDRRRSNRAQLANVNGS